MRKVSIAKIDFSSYTLEELDKLIFFATLHRSTKINYQKAVQEVRDFMAKKGLSPKDIKHNLEQKRLQREIEKETLRRQHLKNEINSKPQDPFASLP